MKNLLIIAVGLLLQSASIFTIGIAPCCFLLLLLLFSVSTSRAPPPTSLSSCKDAGGGGGGSSNEGGTTWLPLAYVEFGHTMACCICSVYTTNKHIFGKNLENARYNY